MDVLISPDNSSPLNVEIHCVEKDAQVCILADEIAALDRKGQVPKVLAGYKGNILTLLKPDSVLRFYSFNKKVWAQTDDGDFELKQRLYALEQWSQVSDADNAFRNFIRVSNTDIVNFDLVYNLDMNINGAIKINFKNKESCFVSRRYVNKVMFRLGIKG